MRNLLTTLAIGAAFSAMPATLAAQATTTVERQVEFFESFSDYNPCNDEPITVSGTFTTTRRTTVDARGLTHESATVVGKLEGVGASGAKYLIQAPERLVDTYVVGEDFPFHRNYTLAIHYISQGKAPNFMLTYNFHWTIAADGTTKLFVEHVNETCFGKS